METVTKNSALNIEKFRQDFPILSKKVNGKPLVHLDNGATTQKPKQVIDAINNYYQTQNANIHLDEMPPYKAGGGTIKTVTFEKTEYADLPLKFEAGTPNIEGDIGLAAAIDYVNEIGFENIGAYECELLEYATAKLSGIEGLRIIGTAKEKASVISFVIEGVHPLDIGTTLDKQRIAAHTGHHYTQPLIEYFGIPGTIRASMVFYNTKEEIDVLVNGIQKAIKMLK